MSVVIINGDIFKALQNKEIDIIAHGCNCKGGFGSGIAGQVAKKFPNVRNAYKEKYQIEGWKLGEVQEVPIGNNQSIINCATQNNYIPHGEIHVDYEALTKIIKFLYSTENKRIGIPKIGCGLAGGDWETVERIITDIFINKDIRVYWI